MDVASGQGHEIKNNMPPSWEPTQEDYELAHKFLELVKYYSPTAVIDIMAIRRLGFDPEKYYIEQSDGYPWNGWLIDRETGFAEFVAGLYWRYVEERRYIGSRVLSVLSVFEDELVDITFSARCEADSIRSEWERVMNVKPGWK